eukprot:CAMPEP_0204009802 /NCGR_PEP_ID=MMETSP0360-20130528/22092_1 /ASSEMBLY_ACC=CAM_ASM_000342 /TAXON_ID=268821 /ORGANISM="Scrippsiella Hangoei, Strain SHTV-5" /LENGTH=133 /DNA_ID=CAMNT_0050952193 /DNA_START=250 /DNA_END=648 /DNA_ORIENTATION=-
MTRYQKRSLFLRKTAHLDLRSAPQALQRKSIGSPISCTSSLRVMSGFKWTSGGGTPRASLSSPPWPACTRPEKAEADDSREATFSASNRLRQAANRAQRWLSRRGTAASFFWRARKSAKSVCKRSRTGAFLGS